MLTYSKFPYTCKSLGESFRRWNSTRFPGHHTSDMGSYNADNLLWIVLFSSLAAHLLDHSLFSETTPIRTPLTLPDILARISLRKPDFHVNISKTILTSVASNGLRRICAVHSRPCWSWHQPVRLGSSEPQSQSELSVEHTCIQHLWSRSICNGGKAKSSPNGENVLNVSFRFLSVSGAGSLTFSELATRSCT
jgi:hypothetical protein